MLQARETPAEPMASYIYGFRQHLGMTQREFAEMIGTTIPTVQKYEHGRLKPSGPLLKLLEILSSRHGYGTPPTTFARLGPRK